MVAKVSDLAEELVAKAAELPDEEREFVARTLRGMPRRTQATAADRHAVIADRIRRVHAGEVVTLSVDEVERSLREELDF